MGVSRGYNSLVTEPERPRASSFPGTCVVGDRVELRTVGPLSIEQAQSMISRAVEETGRLGLRKLLVLAAEIELPALPTTLDRYNAVVEWARVGGGTVRIAVVTRAEIMDPGRFDVQLASALGSQLFVCTSEADAVAWLDSA